MGIYTGPEIVRDGLVFGYNADDRSTRFYKGEPTINEADTDFKRTIAFYQGGVTVSSGTVSDAPEKGDGWKKIIINNRGSQPTIARFFYFNHNSGITKTYSVEYDFGTTSGYYWILNGSLGINVSSDNGKKAIVTYASSTNLTESIFLQHDIINVSGITDTIYYRNYQVETKPHATQFTSGTRLTTNSLIDLSGNNSIDLSNVSFDSTAHPYFNGIDNKIIVPHSTSLMPSSFTLCGWIKLFSNKNWMMINKGYAGQSGTFYIYGDSSLLVGQAAVFSSSGTRYQAMFTTNLGINKWAYLCATFNEYTGLLKTYQNGIICNTASGVSSGYNTTPLYIGSFINGSYFVEGNIKNIMFYNRVLSENEIMKNYNAHKSIYIQ